MPVSFWMNIQNRHRVRGVSPGEIHPHPGPLPSREREKTAVSRLVLDVLCRARHFIHLFLILSLIFPVLQPLWASETETQAFSGKISAEAGSFQSPGSALAAYQYSNLSLESTQDLSSALSLGLEGEADWQSAGYPMTPTWPLYPANNVVKLEANNLSSSDGEDLYSLRLNRAYFHLATGRLDVTAGLFKPEWGYSYFYRPTDYFNPLSPLQWKDAESLGSEGLDASCFLFDDLSLEGAVRWLEGGAANGVLKLVDKGIGITFTPSLAWMTDRNGFGLEAVGTFPTIQVRLEGVNWLYPDGHTATNWNLGFSTSHEGMKYTAEFLRDETGEILGNDSSQITQVTYAFLSAEGKFFSQWKAAPALVASLERGPFFFWPKLSWGFEPSWELSFQAQWLIGAWEGPLDLTPGRTGVSLAYSF
jgi:hypothetical protein